MERYDIFKSQGGYGVALGIYNGCPVVGSIRWFETRFKAEEYTKNHKAYCAAYDQWEESLKYSAPDEIPDPPKEEDYNLLVGFTV